MCHFITLVTDCSDEAQLKALLHTHDRKLTPDDHPSIQKALAEGERQYLTAHHCDCGTMLGNLGAVKATADDSARLKATKERLGWSQTKIERCLKDRHAANSKKPERDDPYTFEFWSGLLETVLRIPETSTAGLIVHRLGQTGDDIFTVMRRNVPKRGDVLKEIKNMREHELVVATSKRAV